MAIDRHKVFIVGCGPGGPDYVTPAAGRAVARAKTVLGARRLLRLFPDSLARHLPLPAATGAAIETVAEHLRAGPVAVLVSGDPGLFSLAKAIVGRFGRSDCEVVPAVSSLQAAFARLGLDWADARILSAHGRIPQVSVEQLRRSEKIAVLAGTPEATSWVGRMAEQLTGTHALFVGENLTLAEETFRELRPKELHTAECSSLSVMILVRRGLILEEQQASDSRGG